MDVEFGLAFVRVSNGGVFCVMMDMIGMYCDGSFGVFLVYDSDG